MQCVHVRIFLFQAPLIQPVVQPRSEKDDVCGDIVFPKTIPSCIDTSIYAGFQNDSNVSVNFDEAVNIENSTRKQANESSWFEERAKRITASNFGHIMTRKKEINDSFMKSTFQKTNFTSAPTSYGKANETIAKQMYIKQTGNHIHDIGLIVNPAIPFLGATPDAIVCDKSDTGLVEIKCPYSVRDMTLNDACNNRADFFLRRNGDEFNLSRQHAHWYQVQGQLLASGAPFCDFVTYTKQELSIERITPDEDTMKALVEKLSAFYIQLFKPYYAKIKSTE